MKHPYQADLACLPVMAEKGTAKGSASRNAPLPSLCAVQRCFLDMVAAWQVWLQSRSSGRTATSQLEITLQHPCAAIQTADGAGDRSDVAAAPNAALRASFEAARALVGADGSNAGQFALAALQVLQHAATGMHIYCYCPGILWLFQDGE